MVCRLGMGLPAALRDRSEPMPAPKGLECDLWSLPIGALADDATGAEADACLRES